MRDLLSNLNPQAYAASCTNGQCSQFEITPKAFANFSPELERSDNSGNPDTRGKTNPERVLPAKNPFRVDYYFVFWPTQGSRCARTLGLKLANASGVISNLNITTNGAMPAVFQLRAPPSASVGWWVLARHPRLAFSPGIYLCKHKRPGRIHCYPESP